MTAVLAANDRIVEYLPVLIMLLFAVGFVTVNLGIDLLYAAIDPRIRYS